MTHLLHKFEEKYTNLKRPQKKKCKYYKWDVMNWSKVCIAWGEEGSCFFNTKYG